jgi:hypothetical protein
MSVHLVLKLPLLYDAAAKELRRESLWLDRLANGLLSRAAAAGFFETRNEMAGPWLCLRPVWGVFDSCWVWADNETVDWNALKRAVPEPEGLRFPERHAFSEAELKAGRKAFPALTEWKTLEK